MKRDRYCELAELVFVCDLLLRLASPHTPFLTFASVFLLLHYFQHQPLPLDTLSFLNFLRYLKV